MVKQTDALLPLGFVPGDDLSIDLIEDSEPLSTTLDTFSIGVTLLTAMVVTSRSRL